MIKKYLIKITQNNLSKSGIFIEREYIISTSGCGLYDYFSPGCARGNKNKLENEYLIFENLETAKEILQELKKITELKKSVKKQLCKISNTHPIRIFGFVNEETTKLEILCFETPDKSEALKILGFHNNVKNNHNKIKNIEEEIKQEVKNGDYYTDSSFKWDSDYKITGDDFYDFLDGDGEKIHKVYQLDKTIYCPINNEFIKIYENGEQKKSKFSLDCKKFPAFNLNVVFIENV